MSIINIPTDIEALIKGDKSGLFNESMGVGTVII